MQGHFFPVTKLRMLGLSSTRNCYQLLSNIQMKWSQHYLMLIKERKTSEAAESHQCQVLSPFYRQTNKRLSSFISPFMQLCLQMEKLWQHESTFMDIAYISGTNIRPAQNPESSQAQRH